MPPIPESPPPDTPALARGTLATLGEQLAAWYAQRIRERALAPGACLPSVRAAARRHGLSPSTVVAAYDLLQAQGLVEARAQRGFFVRESMPSPVRPRMPVRPLPPLDAATLVRSMFEHQGARAPSPGIGTLPADWLDLPLLHGALRRAMAEDRRDPTSLRYGDPAGDARLRGALARRLGDFGIAADAGQIVTTVGATAALDLVSHLLLAPGDSVLVDEPGWPVEFARLAQMGVKCVPVPRAADGPDRVALRRLLEGWQRPDKPRALITVSVLHNPTGSTLTLAAAHELLKLAEAHDLTLVEDDTYAWLAPAQAPRLAALDQLQRTVYIGGFAKILTPNWRVGYLAAAPALVERAIDRKLLTTLAAPGLTERALAIALEQGTLRRHAERVSQRLEAARQRSARLAREAGFAFAAPPQGLFGWLDTGVNSDALSQRLHAEGWLLAPGSLFLATPRSTPLMRVNFAAAQDARLWRALRTACDALGGHPTLKVGAVTSGNETYHSPEAIAPEPSA
ncbi:MAG TPA: PLP-dependent aminotransferase family protein [Burkholderiaceae bacterium]|nr:PLP-dependent aminotransferase family protein [Burkholderiaceae bacterium]